MSMSKECACSRSPAAADEPRSTNQVLAMIDAYIAKGDLGQAFSGYLYLLHNDPGCRGRIKEDFVTILTHWADQQEAAGQDEEALCCFEVARQMWPENARIYNGMGAFLHRLGESEEAVLCFRLALEIDPGYVGAKINLANVVGSSFEGWHFPMLNDRKRNESYQTAISRAIAQGHDTVLDIGSGTGLLSMFAVSAGARAVHACEESKHMVKLSRDVLKTNGMQDKIQLLHKLSTEMSVPADIPNRVSLVVTEIFDAGLLGEGAIHTLRHAWEHLLLPPKTSDSQLRGSYGRVIPAKAMVYAQVVQCPYIRKQYRLLNEKICHLNVMHLQHLWSASSDEAVWSERSSQQKPYTSERLREVPLGYRVLTPTAKVLEIDFNNPKVLTPQHPTSEWKHIDLPVIHDGQVDAIVSWFELHLDDTVQLSSSPESDSCWEQAVFPVNRISRGSKSGADGGYCQGDFHVNKRDVITLAVSCHGDCLHLKCAAITQHAQSRMEVSTSKVPAKTLDDTMESLVTSFKNNIGPGDRAPSDLLKNNFMKNNSAKLTGETTPAIDATISLCDESDTISLLNDDKFCTACFNAIQTLLQNFSLHDPKTSAMQNSTQTNPPDDWQVTKTGSLPLAGIEHDSSVSVLDISVSLPLSGLFAAMFCPDVKVHIPTGQSETRSLVQSIAKMNGIENCINFGTEPHPLTPASKMASDVLVTDLVSSCGLLRERGLEDIAVGRVCALKATGRVLPECVSVFAMCIECSSLQKDSVVEGTECTLGLKIAEHINKYKVSTFQDLHLSTLDYKQLSTPFMAIRLDLNEKTHPDQSDLPGFVNQVTTHELEALHDGMITAIPFWYDIGMDANNHVNTLDNDTHWRQAAFLLESGKSVRKGGRLRVMARVEDSSFHFEVEVG